MAWRILFPNAIVKQKAASPVVKQKVMCESCYGYFLDDGGELIHGKLLCESCSDDLVRDQLKKYFFQYTMSDNKLVKTIMAAATLTGIAAGIGWIGKKVVKENFTKDPSSNVMNYAKFTAVMAGSIALKQYLEEQKILPD